MTAKNFVQEQQERGYEAYYIDGVDVEKIVLDTIRATAEYIDVKEPQDRREYLKQVRENIDNLIAQCNKEGK